MSAPNPRQEAHEGTYEIGVIADVLLTLASAEISNARPIEGTTIQWLSEQLTVSLKRIEGYVG